MWRLGDNVEDFDDFMTDTIIIEPLVSRDTYGLANYGPAVTYACRIDATTKQTVNINGVERSISAMIYLKDNPIILPADRLTMPAFFTPQQPPMLRIAPFTDESGAHHTEIAV